VLARPKGPLQTEPLPTEIRSGLSALCLQYDLGKRNPDGHVDIPRMREGGMNGTFFSIWIHGRITEPLAIKKGIDQIDAVRENVSRYPGHIVLVRTAEEVRRAHAESKISALMGVRVAT
jgi:membrane dipeptidase